METGWESDRKLACGVGLEVGGVVRMIVGLGEGWKVGPGVGQELRWEVGWEVRPRVQEAIRKSGAERGGELVRESGKEPGVGWEVRWGGWMMSRAGSHTFTLTIADLSLSSFLLFTVLQPLSLPLSHASPHAVSSDFTLISFNKELISLPCQADFSSVVVFCLKFRNGTGWPL